MSPAVKRRKSTPIIAQASADPVLANSRVEVLQNAGYKVRTFMSQDKLAIACKNETFDLLLVGHLLEHVEREQACRSSNCRQCKPSLVLRIMNSTWRTARKLSFNS